MKLVSLYFAIISDKWVSHPGGNLKILIFEIHHPPLLRTCTSRIMQISFANENRPQNILEALTPCSSFHFLDLRFRFTFDFAWLSPFTVVHWLLCAWFTFTFQLYHRSFKVYIHFSIKFTFPLLLNSLSLFQLDLLRWEGRRTQVDLHGQLLVSSSISCPQTQIQFQLEIFRSWDKLIFLSKLYQKHKRRRLIYDFRH